MNSAILHSYDPFGNIRRPVADLSKHPFHTPDTIQGINRSQQLYNLGSFAVFANHLRPKLRYFMNIRMRLVVPGREVTDDKSFLIGHFNALGKVLSGLIVLKINRLIWLIGYQHFTPLAFIRSALFNALQAGNELQ